MRNAQRRRRDRRLGEFGRSADCEVAFTGPDRSPTFLRFFLRLAEMTLFSQCREGNANR